MSSSVNKLGEKEKADLKQQLNIEQNLFQALMDNTTDLVVVYDQKGRIVNLSRSCEQYTGYTLQDVKGKYIWDVVYTPEEADNIKAIFAYWILGSPDPGLHQQENYISNWFTRGGIRRELSWKATTYRTEDSSEVYVILVGTDIIRHKMIEERLRENEQELRSILENTSIIVYALSPDKKIRFVSTGWRLQLGYEPAQAYNDTFSQLIHPDDVAAINNLVEMTFLTGKPTPTFTYRIRHLDGLWRWHSSSGLSVNDRNGNPLYFVGIATDITEQKKSAEALQESERRFRELLENVNLVAGVLDTQGNILFCNDCLLKLTGWKIDEVLGKSWFDTFCSDAMRHLDYKVINRSVTRGLPPSNGESEIRTRSGEIRRIMWSNTLLRNADGSIAGFASIGEDVTEHRLAEAQSQKLLHDLEMANRELKDFAYIVSHDLKAPLRGIRSLVNWLYSDNFDKLDEHGREQLHLLENRVNRMQNLLEGILQYSRAGYKKDEQTWINIREIVEEVLEMLDPPGNIDIIIEGDLPVLMLDRTRAQEIFSNLIGNAIKFMDKPQGLIKISACPQNGFWQFSISDNGPGIPEKYHQKIFTIFQTLRSRDDFESTGIGLTIVKKIIEIYNGRIWLESEPGSGSTFYFTLPMPASLP